jgi:hypothetical protein
MYRLHFDKEEQDRAPPICLARREPNSILPGFYDPIV